LCLIGRLRQQQAGSRSWLQLFNQSVKKHDRHLSRNRRLRDSQILLLRSIINLMTMMMALVDDESTHIVECLLMSVLLELVKNTFFCYSCPPTSVLMISLAENYAVFFICERQSAQMSKITNDCLTRSSTGCSVAVPTWQQWASKG